MLKKMAVLFLFRVGGELARLITRYDGDTI